MGGKKNDCYEKKCKKRCVEYNYEYDQSKLIVAKPVPDQYVLLPGAPITFSTFGYVDVKDTLLPQNTVGLLEFTNRVFIRSGTLGSPALVEIDGTGFLNNGTTTVSFILSFNTDGSNFLLPPGVYKIIPYSSTGDFYDKDCYLTVIVSPVNESSLIRINLKVCDRKSCSNKFLIPV